MVVVIDANCLLASIPPQSSHYWLYIAFEQEKFSWVIGNEILSEYKEKLIDRYSESTSDIVLNVFSVAPNVIYREANFKQNLVSQDSDDNKFVDLAIAGNADYIVTNDRHFNELKTLEFPKLNIVTLDEFRKTIMGE